MDYDYRKAPSYGAQIPPYRPTASSSHPTYGPPQPSSNLYPRVGQQSQTPISTPSHGGGGGHRNFPHHQTATAPAASTTTTTSGLGIRVAIKPEYRITPPPQMATHLGDVPRSNFQFDFDFEKKVLAEAEKETPNWRKLGLDNPSQSKPAEAPSASSSSSGSVGDPVVRKYVASGLSREAVPLAVATYGDNPAKVREFVSGFNTLHEMGFPANSVAEALLMYDNDQEKALAYLINSSS